MASADELISSLKGYDSNSFKDESERFRARQALYETMRRVDRPWDIAASHCWVEPINTAAIKLFIDAGLWKKWEAAGAKPASSEEISRMSGVDRDMTQRLMRHMACEGFVTQEGEDTFGMNRFSRELAGEHFPRIYDVLYLVSQPSFANFPTFAKDTNYANPTDSKNGNVQSWRSKETGFFDLYNEIPGLEKAFGSCMAYYAGAQAAWVDVYPTESIIANAKPGRALVVDIGGSHGHDLEKVRAKHPEVEAGSYVLQDLEPVVAEAVVQGPAAVAMAHDFFTPQPVKGARVYYLHSVCHDWSDDKAVEILQNTAAAMERGYSRILLHEMVVRGSKSHPHVFWSDIVMMMCVSGAERTEDAWAKLAASAGLKITKIHSTAVSVHNVIELELA